MKKKIRKINNDIKSFIDIFWGAGAHAASGVLTALLSTFNVFIAIMSISIFLIYEFSELFHGDEPSQEIQEFGAGWFITIIFYLIYLLITTGGII